MQSRHEHVSATTVGRASSTDLIARRVARSANPRSRVEAIAGNVIDPDVAARILDCDYAFLAADSMQARLVFNAVVHQLPSRDGM